MSRIATAIASVSVLSASAAAQDFLPFGEVSGTITMGGDYNTAPCCPGYGEDWLTMPIALSGEVQDVSFDSGAAAGGTGVEVWASWVQWNDSHPADPQIIEVIESYEWEFNLTGHTNSGQAYGSIAIDLDLVLTEWTDVSLVAVLNETPGRQEFEASIGGLVADSHGCYSCPFSQYGNMYWDRRFNRSMLLGPGTHHLSIMAWIWPETHVNGELPVNATVRVQFERGWCPGDLNHDSILDNGDIGSFVTLFLSGCP